MLSWELSGNSSSGASSSSRSYEWRSKRSCHDLSVSATTASRPAQLEDFNFKREGAHGGVSTVNAVDTPAKDIEKDFVEEGEEEETFDGYAISLDQDGDEDDIGKETITELDQDMIADIEEAFSHEPTFNDDIEEIGGVEIKVVQANKIYGEGEGAFHAVRDASLNLKKGSITALLGPSGSGKTTLMRMISGLETMTTGKVFFDGVDVTEWPVQDREIGFVFQSYALFAHMSVRENIGFGPRIRKLDMDIDKRVNELLKLIQLEHIADR